MHPVHTNLICHSVDPNAWGAELNPDFTCLIGSKTTSVKNKALTQGGEARNGNLISELGPVILIW